MAFTERYVTTTGAGGHDGTSESDAWDFDEMVTAVAAHSGSPLRVNAKAGTYSLSANKTLSGSPDDPTLPYMIRGYSSAIGDADDDTTFTGVTFAFGSGYLLQLNKPITLKNIVITGNINNYLIKLEDWNQGVLFDNCTVENSNTGSGARAVYSSHNYKNHAFMRCRLYTASTSAPVVYIPGSLLVDCVVEGGNYGVYFLEGGTRLIGCVFTGQATAGIYVPKTGYVVEPMEVINCTIYDSGGDGITISGGYSNIVIVGCVFDTIGGYGVSIASAYNFTLRNCSYYACTSGLHNAANHSAIGSNAESSSPLVSSSDMTLVSGALARASRFPTVFRGESYRSYADIGAVQHQDSGGSSTRSPFGYIG